MMSEQEKATLSEKDLEMTVGGKLDLSRLPSPTLSGPALDKWYEEQKRRESGAGAGGGK